MTTTLSGSLVDVLRARLDGKSSSTSLGGSFLTLDRSSTSPDQPLCSLSVLRAATWERRLSFSARSTAVSSLAVRAIAWKNDERSPSPCSNKRTFSSSSATYSCLLSRNARCDARFNAFLLCTRVKKRRQWAGSTGCEDEGRTDSGTASAGLRPGLGRGGTTHSLVVVRIGRASVRELAAIGPEARATARGATVLGGIVARVFPERFLLPETVRGGRGGVG